MSLVKNFRMMSLYNQRMNNQLLRTCQTLSPEILEKETHSFFPTIMSYWNHILFGDLILLGRLASNNIAGFSHENLAELPLAKRVDDIFHEELSDFSILRKKVDTLIVQYCEVLTNEEYEKTITYTSTEGQLISKVVADVIQHFFNHQTHHRGQLTCILSQFGVDYGCTDLPVIVYEGS